MVYTIQLDGIQGRSLEDRALSIRGEPLRQEHWRSAAKSVCMRRFRNFILAVALVSTALLSLPAQADPAEVLTGSLVASPKAILGHFYVEPPNWGSYWLAAYEAGPSDTFVGTRVVVVHQSASGTKVDDVILPAGVIRYVETEEEQKNAISNSSSFEASFNAVLPQTGEWKDFRWEGYTWLPGGAVGGCGGLDGEYDAKSFGAYSPGQGHQPFATINGRRAYVYCDYMGTEVYGWFEYNTIWSHLDN